MNSSPNVDPATMESMRTAAGQRANGASWEAVAESLGQPVAICRRWPIDFSATWNQLLREAKAQSCNAGEAEARTTLRNLLRAKEDKTRIAAAQQLLKPHLTDPVDSAAERAPDEDREIAAFISQVKGLPDEELDTLLRKAVADSRAGAGTCGPASPPRSE